MNRKSRRRSERKCGRRFILMEMQVQRKLLLHYFPPLLSHSREAQTASRILV